MEKLATEFNMSFPEEKRNNFERKNGRKSIYFKTRENDI